MIFCIGDVLSLKFFQKLLFFLQGFIQTWFVIYQNWGRFFARRCFRVCLLLWLFNKCYHLIFLFFDNQSLLLYFLFLSFNLLLQFFILQFELTLEIWQKIWLVLRLMLRLRVVNNSLVKLLLLAPFFSTSLGIWFDFLNNSIIVIMDVRMVRQKIVALALLLLFTSRLCPYHRRTLLMTLCIGFLFLFWLSDQVLLRFFTHLKTQKFIRSIIKIRQ